MDIASQDWFAIYVRTQNEFKISNALKSRFGFETSVPSRKVWKKNSSKVEIFEKPLFSAYIFIKANFAKNDIKHIFSVNGIFDFVRCGSGTPAVIPGKQIESLERMAQSTQLLSEIEYMKLKPNDMVEVVKGPLKGAIGKFLRTDVKSGLFAVSIDLFKRTLVTNLDGLSLKPISV